MTQRQSPEETKPSRAGPVDQARDLVLNTLTARNVAAWCGVGVLTPYQWLNRATDDVPFPVAHVLPVVRGAYAAGLRFDIAILWPAWRELRL